MSDSTQEKPSQADTKLSYDATTTTILTAPDQLQSSAAGNTMLTNLFNKKDDQSGAIAAAVTGSQMKPVNEHLANMVQNFFQSASQDLAADIDMIKVFETNRQQAFLALINKGILMCPKAAGTGQSHYMYTLPEIHEVKELHINQIVHNLVSKESTSGGVSVGPVSIGISHDSMDVDHLEKLDFITCNKRSMTFTRGCIFCDGYKDNSLPQTTEEVRSLNQSELRQYLIDLQTRELTARQTPSSACQ